MTPRQKALADIINAMYREKAGLTPENVLKTIEKNFKTLDNSAQKYIVHMSFRSERVFKTEVLEYLKRGLILDYSDFGRGGRYLGYRKIIFYK
jgi:hypothetical protein